MSDCMTFPNTVEEFMEDYKVVDTDQVYSNGTEFVPIFRMKQWFEHLQDAPTVEPEPHWIPVSEKAHPDLPIRVQVQMSNGWIITAHYQDGEWLSVPNCEDAIHDEWIEAWRELPELYRKKRRTEMIGLKPCPFCGSNMVNVVEHEYHPLSNSYGVKCFNCKTESYQYFDTKQKAIEAWNTRGGEQDE